MNLTQEQLQTLSKDALIALLTGGYKEYASEIFGVQTKLIYDEKTDTVINFEVSDNLFDIFAEDIIGDDCYEVELEHLFFLETIRQAGFTNMFSSGKYLENFYGEKKALWYFIKNYTRIFNPELMI